MNPCCNRAITACGIETDTIRFSKPFTFVATGLLPLAVLKLPESRRWRNCSKVATGLLPLAVLKRNRRRRKGEYTRCNRAITACGIETASLKRESLSATVGCNRAITACGIETPRIPDTTLAVSVLQQGYYRLRY